MADIQMDGVHVSDHAVIGQKRSNILGIPYCVTVTHGDAMHIETLAEPDPKYHELEEFAADGAVFAAHKMWAQLAECAGKMIVEGARVEVPEAARAIMLAIQLVEAIAVKDWAAAGTIIIPFLEELAKLAPEIKALQRSNA